MSAFDLICVVSDYVTNAAPTFSETLASANNRRLVLQFGANGWVFLQLWQGLSPLMVLPVAYCAGKEWRLDFTASSCKLAELVGMLERFGLEVRG